MVDTALQGLKEVIMGAMAAYQKKHPRRSQSTHRAADIKAMTDICEQAVDKEMLLNQLEDYFTYHFYTGLTDSSVLEELIVDAVFKVDEDARNGLGTFSAYRPHAHPSMDAKLNDALSHETRLNYQLTDFMDYAVDKYQQENKGKMKDYRQVNIDHLLTLLNSNKSDEEKAVEIRQYVNSDAFTHGFNSNLKKYVLTALKYYQKTPQERSVATRTWAPISKTDPPKIMIFLHGWHDSVNAGDRLAREAVKQGFTVIAYDHRGHGKDAERSKKGIPMDLLRIDFRVFLKSVSEAHPDAEIALAGHSMGGAILVAEQAFINAKPPIKSVALIAPAVMSFVGKMISPAKLLYRNMHANVKASQHASDRFGGKGPSLFSLLMFMRRCAKSLKEVLSPTAEHASQWQIYTGDKDASVNRSEFTSLPKNNLHFFSRGDHALQFGHRSGSVNRAILNDMAMCFSDNKPSLPAP